MTPRAARGEAGASAVAIAATSRVLPGCLGACIGVLDSLAVTPAKSGAQALALWSILVSDFVPLMDRNRRILKEPLPGPVRAPPAAAAPPFGG